MVPPPRNSLLIFQEIFPICHVKYSVFSAFFRQILNIPQLPRVSIPLLPPYQPHTQKSLGTRFPPYLKTLHEGMGGGGGGGGRRSIGPLHSTFDTIHPIDLIYTKLSLYFQLSKATWCPKYVSIGRAEKCLRYFFHKLF